MPGTADDRFANMYEDPFGNPLNDPRVVSEEMGLVGNQVPQGIRFNNPIGGVDQFAKEMEALEANLPMGVNAIMTPEMMGGTLQDFYTNRNLTGASTGGIPSNAKSMFEVFNDNVNFNDQASLPNNNLVADASKNNNLQTLENIINKDMFEKNLEPAIENQNKTNERLEELQKELGIIT